MYKWQYLRKTSFPESSSIINQSVDISNLNAFSKNHQNEVYVLLFAIEYEKTALHHISDYTHENVKISEIVICGFKIEI